MGSTRLKLATINAKVLTNQYKSSVVFLVYHIILYRLNTNFCTIFYILFYILLIITWIFDKESKQYIYIYMKHSK